MALSMETSGACARCDGRRPLTQALLHRWVAVGQSQY